MDLSIHAAAEQLLDKSPPDDGRATAATIDMFLRVAERFGYVFAPGDKVLDFGCGLGATVEALLDRGSDAYGMDIAAFWSEDYDRYPRSAPKPPAHVVERLRKVDPDHYVLPFPDNHFDFCISAQVFEHLAEDERVIAFRELMRVLKPGALSLHNFPGPGQIIEGHINVPLAFLCHSKAWLKLWALTGRRSARQQNSTWPETLEANVLQMRITFFPTKGTLRKNAKAAGANISFCERDYMETSGARPGKLLALTDHVGLGRLVAPILSILSQRMMVLRKPK
jgi:SAM-dependent methyltransferase